MTIATVPPSGADADLSHLEYPSNMFGFAIDLSQPAVDQLEECLTVCHLVLSPAGMPQKLRMTCDDLFKSMLVSPGRSSKPVGISVPRH